MKDDSARVSLVKELCERFNASESAMLCGMSHGQVTVDGYTVAPKDDKRWTRAQLGGRTAVVMGREARLFGMSHRCRTPATSSVQAANSSYD